MAPSPAQALELRSYNKGNSSKDDGIVAEKSNDKKPPKANIDEVEEFNFKKADENSLKTLLEEALSYRNPPDKHGKSKVFQDLLSEVQQKDLDRDLERQYKNRQSLVGLRNGYFTNSSSNSSVLNSNDHSTDYEDRRRRKYHHKNNNNGDLLHNGGTSASASGSSGSGSGGVSSTRKSKFSHSLKINPNNHHHHHHINSCRPQSYSFKHGASKYGKGPSEFSGSSSSSSSSSKKYSNNSATSSSSSYEPAINMNTNMNMNLNLNLTMPGTTVSNTNSKVVMSTAIDSSNCASSLYNNTTHKTLFLPKTVDEIEKQQQRNITNNTNNNNNKEDNYILCSVGSSSSNNNNNNNNEEEGEEEFEMKQMDDTKDTKDTTTTKRYLSRANLQVNGETNDYYYAAPPKGGANTSNRESRLAAMTSPKPTKDMYIPENREEPLRKCFMDNNKHRRMAKVKSERDRDNTVTLLNHKKTPNEVAAGNALLSCLDQNFLLGPWNYPGVTFFQVSTNNIGDLSSRLSLTKEVPEEEKNTTEVSREESVLENGAVKTMSHCISPTQKPYTIIKNTSNGTVKRFRAKAKRYVVQASRLSENIDGFCGDKPIDKLLDYIEKGINPELEEEKRSKRNNNNNNNTKNKIKVVITTTEDEEEEDKKESNNEEIEQEEEEEEEEEINNKGIEGDIEEDEGNNNNNTKQCIKTKVKKLKEIKKKDEKMVINNKNNLNKKKIKNKIIENVNINNNNKNIIINNNNRNSNTNMNMNININDNNNDSSNDKDHSSDTNDFHLVTKKTRKKRRRSTTINNNNNKVKDKDKDKIINKDFAAHDYKKEFKNNGDSDCSENHHRHRRKSTCSMQCEEKDSDSDSIHSLPVSSTTPKLRIKKKSISSGCTPQASYADITKSSSGSGFSGWNNNSNNNNRRTRKESVSSQSSMNVECERVIKVVEVATQTFRFECDGCGTSIGPIRKAALRPAKSEGDIHPKCVNMDLGNSQQDNKNNGIMKNNINNTSNNSKGKKQEKKKTINKTPKPRKTEMKGKNEKKVRGTVSDGGGATSKDEGTPEPIEIRKAVSESGKLSETDDLSNPIWYNMEEVVQFVAKGWTEVMKTYPSINNKKSGKTETDSESDTLNNQLKHN